MTQAQENWQQALDELVALEAIYGEDFRLSDVQNVEGVHPDDLTPESLLEVDAPKSDDALLLFDISVEVELPVTSLTLLLELNPGQSAQHPATAEGTDPGSSSALTIPVGAVNHLPPISLGLKVGGSYPSHHPPEITLQAIWLLPDQIGDLVQQLHDLWTDQGPGMPICFTWADWLKYSTLQHLGVADSLVLREAAQEAAGDNGWAGGQQVVQHLLRYAALREADEFNQGLWQCGICFEEVLGEQCMRLPGCTHFYCFECLQQDCSIKIKDGAVDSLKCPHPECRAPIPPACVKQLITEDEFQRWEDLLLQRTLDRMQDVVYCPRCQVSVIEDPDHCAQCTKCLYVFCSMCCDSWHPGSQCIDAVAKLQVMQKRRDRAGSTSDAERLRAEADLMNQLLSLKEIRGSTRQCPQCQMAIQKTEGCNKMTCFNCSAKFCYKCGCAIEGYDHFGGGCRLFDPEDIAAWEAEMAGHQLRNHQIVEGHMAAQIAAGNAILRGRICRCPLCGQANLKEGQNNAMRCWACSSHFCYSCRVPLRGRGAVGQHFTKSQSGQRPCRQHTAD